MSSEEVVIGLIPRDRFSMFTRCLEALYAHTNLAFRVVVVAGGAPVAMRQRLLNLQQQRNNLTVVLTDTLLDQSEARNVALRQVDERFCVLLENDTIVHKGWLDPLFQCLQEERAAVVSPLILSCWDDTIHAAGGEFDERQTASGVEFRHKILYQGVKSSNLAQQRARIDFPETHCVLIDRQQLPADYLFDGVEPFDADLGLTLRKSGLSAFLEPRSLATYEPPPPMEVADIGAYKFRWDWDAWADRNRRFMKKWNFNYDASEKRVSYRRQHLKLGLARWYANELTVCVSNASVGFVRLLRSKVSAFEN
jgi:glycosyltransferase involved in cell wall biosynthesis